MVKSGVMMKGLLCAACLTFSPSHLLLCPAGAQMLTDIKVVAIQYKDSLKDHTKGYTGGDNLDLDFRKGRGGGYVFTLFKNSTDTAKYITDVEITDSRKAAYGLKYNDHDKSYTPAPFFQANSRKDAQYRGGLNGRNYSIFGGAYPEQPHIYISRTGNTDFNNKVLKSAYVTTSKPKDLPNGSWYSGPHAGGGRYIVFTWHKHEPKYRKKDINNHIHYCDLDNCGIEKVEPHNFPKLYGYDKWSQFEKTDEDSVTCTEKHYKECLDCGQIVSEVHQFATFVSNSDDHNKRCLMCDYVEQSSHKNFGKQKLPVDEEYHMIFCDDCGFLKKFRHDFGSDRTIKAQDCEHTLVEYACKQCYHHAFFEEPGIGHDYDEYGICRREECLHPYEQPTVERLDTIGNDSVFVVKTFGNLYWVADYINNRHPKANVRLANDLIAENFMRVPWRPIGDTDSTAYQGTFYGDGHLISMLQTEEPIAGCGYRGLFGVVAKDGVVKDVTVAACNMRGWDNIGGVAGVNYGKIDKCHVVFSIMNSISSGINIGGICGMNKKTGTISGCTTGDDVWVGGVRDYAGGICGTNDGGTLTNNTSAAICGSGSDAVLPETASNQ